jgi:hypothetical protein
MNGVNMNVNNPEICDTYYANATEDERKIFREWLGDVLRNHDVTLHFRKKDGSVRIMECTLQEGKVKEYTKKTERVKAVSEDTCPVFDTEKNEWRSFRYDSVTQINFDIGGNK